MTSVWADRRRSHRRRTASDSALFHRATAAQPWKHFSRASSFQTTRVTLKRQRQRWRRGTRGKRLVWTRCFRLQTRAGVQNVFCPHFRVAHASRVLAMVSSPSRTFPLTPPFVRLICFTKACLGGAPKPARGMRARPRRINHASFFRNRRAHRPKRRFDITISTNRFGQYSKKFAPRKMIARMSAMKYVVGNSAPSA